MKHCIFYLLLLISGLAQAINLVTEDYPPFNFVDDQSKRIIGISADKINIMMQRAKIDYTIDTYPWTRAFQMAKESPDTCVFSTVRNPERENLFRWVGPFGNNNWVVYVRSSSHNMPQSLEDLRPYTIGVYRNSAIGTYLQQQGFNLDWANNDLENPKKLTYGRFDYWATGEMLGQYHIARAGLRGQIVQAFKFYSADMYLACNPAIPQATINKLNQVLREMERDGTSTAIDHKYKSAEQFH